MLNINWLYVTLKRNGLPVMGSPLRFMLPVLFGVSPAEP